MSSQSFNLGNLKIDRTLGLIVTNKCNIKCDFCAVQAGPTGNKNLDLANAKQAIHGFKRFGVNKVSLTGGEVFCVEEELFEFADFCNKKSIPFAIATNGSVAKNKHQALALLKKLKEKGLKKILVSYDYSHSRYIEKDVFLNFLEICRTIEIETTIYSTYLSGKPRFNDLIKESECYPFIVYESPAVEAGRAKNECYDDLEMNINSKAKKCHGPVSITINYDGIVYPCCSVLGFSDNLAIGSIYHNSINELIDVLKNDIFVFYIKTFGFEKLKSIFSLSAFEESRMISVCHWCKYISSSTDRYEKAIKMIMDDVRAYLISKLSNTAIA